MEGLAFFVFMAGLAIGAIVALGATAVITHTKQLEDEANRHDDWEDGKVSVPTDDRTIFVKCQVSDGDSRITVTASGKYVAEEKAFRLGRGVKFDAQTSVFLYWMDVPELPEDYETRTPEKD